MTLPNVEPDAVLAEAHRLAALGHRVLPITPGLKYPPLKAWQDAATTDPAIIAGWFTGLYRGHGLGVATGAGSGVWVLDIDVGPDKAGDETIADLERDNGPLPDTVEAETGSGGRHLWFAWPASGDIRNDAGSRLGAGLDVRGTGGQVLVPPTLHPSGRPYRWIIDHAPGEIPVADAPWWLLDMLLDTPRPARPLPPPQRHHEPCQPDDGPAARHNAATNWADTLTADGWTYAGADRDGEQHWVRPGKDPRQGASATVGYQGADMLRVFTGALTWLPPGAYSRFGYYACRWHGGDRSAAARALRAEQAPPAEPRPPRPESAPEPPSDWEDVGEDIATWEAEWPARKAEEIVRAAAQEERRDLLPDLTTWEPVDLAPILEGIATGAITRPVPQVCTRADGVGLWYAARINGVFGDSGSGKSWLAMWASAQQVQAGHHVVWIDFEDQADSVTIRMLDLGVTPELIASHFHYLAPDLGFTAVTAAPLLELIDATHPTLIAIDSTGEAMAVQGVKDKDDEVAAWFRTFPRRLARSGAAVVVIDHVTKDPETRGLYAIGSQRKRAAIDGAAYLVEALRQFGQGHAGVAKITAAKDRNGTHVQGAVAAQFHLDATNESPYVVTLRDPDGRSEQPFRPTALMEKISRILELNPQGMSKNALETTVRGKTDYKRLALELLVTEGYVSPLKGGRGGGLQHISMRSYREAEDHPETSTSPLAPTSPQPRPGRGAKAELRPLVDPPPLGGGERGEVGGSEGEEKSAELRPATTVDPTTGYHDPEEPF